MGGIFVGTERALIYSRQNEHLAYLPAELPLGLLLLVLFMMLLLSNAVAAFGALFMARDLELLLASPITRGTFFFGKLFEVCLNSSWMAIIIAGPAIAAFGSCFHAGISFYITCLLAVIPYFLLPSSIALIVVTLFTRFISLARTRELMILCVALFLTLLYIASQLISPGENSVQNVNDLLGLIAVLSVPNTDWMPSFWAAHAMAAELEFSNMPSLSYLAPLYTSTAVAIALSYLTVRFCYDEAFTRSRSLVHGRKRSSQVTHDLFAKLTPFLSSDARALVSKELKSFARDITQTLQLFLLLGIIVIYLYNFRVLQGVDSLPAGVRLWWQAFLMIINISIGDFVITAICTRFVFPSISLEGASFWILQSAPLTLQRLLCLKFWIWYLPVAFIAGLIFAAGALALRADVAVIILNVISSAVICYGIVGLAIGFGAHFANFDWEHASQLAASFGSLVFMLSSTTLIVLNLIPTGVLMFMRDPETIGRVINTGEWYCAAIAHIAILIVINVRTKQWALAFGENSLINRWK